jgi:hypothetical protein
MTKQRSLPALDWLNFFMADVGTGIGPFLAIYLTATRHCGGVAEHRLGRGTGACGLAG